MEDDSRDGMDARIGDDLPMTGMEYWLGAPVQWPAVLVPLKVALLPFDCKARRMVNSKSPVADRGIQRSHYYLSFLYSSPSTAI
jgi:hypothetical protein